MSNFASSGSKRRREFNFEDMDEYKDWCQWCVHVLHYALIAGNRPKVTEVLEEIRDRLRVPEGRRMFKDADA